MTGETMRSLQEVLNSCSVEVDSFVTRMFPLFNRQDYLVSSGCIGEAPLESSPQFA